MYTSRANVKTPAANTKSLNALAACKQRGAPIPTTAHFPSTHWRMAAARCLPSGERRFPTLRALKSKAHSEDGIRLRPSARMRHPRGMFDGDSIIERSLITVTVSTEASRRKEKSPRSAECSREADDFLFPVLSGRPKEGRGKQAKKTKTKKNQRSPK